MFHLDEKTALITGGSKGIGFATARKFLEAGAKHVIITGRNSSDLNSARVQLSQLGAGKVSCVVSDASDKDAIIALFSWISSQKIQLDILFLNAGTAIRNKVGEGSFESYEQLFAVNALGPMFTVDQSLKHLQSNASIIFNVSAAGSMAIPTLSAYCATKGAILAYMKTIALELSPLGIRVNAVSPGNTDTPLARKNNEGHMEEAAASVPLGAKFSNAQEIASTALFLASDAASSVTGLDLIADRGLSLGAPLKKKK